MKSRMVHWVSQGNNWGLGKPAASLPPPPAPTRRLFCSLTSVWVALWSHYFYSCDSVGTSYV